MNDISLTQSQMLQILSNEIGLKGEIPDILTFIDDDYYLGKIYYDKFKKRSRVYPFWRDVLQDIFPNPLTTKSSFLTFSGCLSGDTKIDLLDGRTLKITEILKEFENGNKNLQIISANTINNRIENDKIVNIWKSGNKKVYEIKLDNGKSFKCTSNHKFLTTNNEWVSIDNGLKVGISLLPYNTKNKNGYIKVENPYTHHWWYRYKLIARFKYGRIAPKGYQIHHINFNKKCDLPENLLEMKEKDHFDLHSSIKNNYLYTEEEFKNYKSYINKARVNALHNDPKYSNVRKIRKEKIGLNMKNGQAKIMSKKRSEMMKTDPEFRKRCTIGLTKLFNSKKSKLTYEELFKFAKDNYIYSPKKLSNKLVLTLKFVNDLILSENESIESFAKKLDLPYFGENCRRVKLPKFDEIYDASVKYNTKDLTILSKILCTKIDYIKNLVKLNEIHFYNHRVVSIDYIGYEDVYDLETEKFHNFSIEAGVFAHNCIGSGKSTVSSIVIMYDMLKLQMMIDPGSFFELINLSGIYLFGASIYKYKADDFINPIKKILANAPFIQDMKKAGTYNKNIKVAPAYSKKSIVSTDAAVVWLSEVNEYKDPDDMISSAIGRMNGRFQKGMGLFNHFILDCSDTTIDSATERFIHDSPYSDRVASYKANIWSIKPHLYWHLDPPGFKVYAGDSVVSPHIISDGEDTKELDEDRLVLVPSELRNQYEIDINKALQETAGLALVSGGLFFPDDRIKEHFNIPMTCDDCPVFDFYDDTEIMDLDGIQEMVEALPDNKYLFVGVDCGYASDHYGLAIGYADGLTYDKLEDGTSIENYFIKIPFVVGFGRKKGQQTNISKIRNFLLEVHSRHPIYCIAYDNHQTVQLAQDMKFNGIKTKYYSVEKDKYPLQFKHDLTQGKIDLAENNTLYREMRCLKHKKGYVDHSRVEATGTEKNHVSQQKGINSKDMFDATVRCYALIRANLNVALDVPKEDSAYHEKLWEDTLKQVEYDALVRKNAMQYMMRSGSFNMSNLNEILKR